eukprot:2856589-Amphidinium_carterae.1
MERKTQKRALANHESSRFLFLSVAKAQLTWKLARDPPNPQGCNSGRSCPDRVAGDRARETHSQETASSTRVYQTKQQMADIKRRDALKE